MRRRLIFAYSLALSLWGCKGTDRSVITLDQHDMATQGGADLAGVVADLSQQPPGTWSDESTGAVDLYGVWGSSLSDVFAVGGTPGTTTGNPGVTVHWNGAAWSSTANLINLLSISGVGVGSATAVGEYGAEGSATYLQGNSWSARDVLAAGTLHGTWQTSPGAYAVGDNGQLLFTTENGIPGSWGMQTSNTTNTLFAVWGSSTSNVFAVGDKGVILHTTNAGVGVTPTWTKTIQGSSQLTSIWGSSDADLYIGGAAPAVILHSTDGGATWTSTTPPTSAIGIFAVSGRAANDVYAVGATGGVIYHSSGGDAWTTEASPTTRDLFGVWVASNGEAYAVGRSGTILHRH